MQRVFKPLEPNQLGSLQEAPPTSCRWRCVWLRDRCGSRGSNRNCKRTMRKRENAFLGAIQSTPQIGHCVLLAFQLGDQHLNSDPQDFLSKGKGCKWFLM